MRAFSNDRLEKKLAKKRTEITFIRSFTFTAMTECATCV